jgi:hypothetical protein
MRRHPERQRVLVENVADADPPDYRPRDPGAEFSRAAEARFAGAHHPQHIAADNADAGFAAADNLHYGMQPEGGIRRRKSHRMRWISRRWPTSIRAVARAAWHGRNRSAAGALPGAAIIGYVMRLRRTVVRPT